MLKIVTLHDLGTRECVLKQEAKELRERQLKADQVVVSQSEFLNLNFKQLEDRVSVYLAGAITELKDPDDNYRAKLIPELKQIFQKCIVIDPLHDADWRAGCGYVSEELNKTIVTNSFKVAIRSNIIVAQILSNINSPGTWFELFVAIPNASKNHQIYVVTDMASNMFLQEFQDNTENFFIFSSFEGLLAHLRTKFQEPLESHERTTFNRTSKSVRDFCTQKSYADVVADNSWFEVKEIKAGHPQEVIKKMLVRRMCYE